jgi:UDP-glucose 4-epimerase
MNRTALVTGGSGFLGGHLAERLVSDGWRVRVVDLRPPRLDCDVEWVCADVRDGETLRDAAGGTNVLFHLGSVVGVGAVLGDPVEAIDVSVNGTRNALDAAAAAGAALVHVSTSEVLGLNAEVPWSEDADRVIGSPFADRWSYAAGKAAAEHIVLAGARARSVPATIIRPFNVYGPRQAERFVVPMMIGAALRNESITVHGDGRQTRCFTYVDDVTSALLLAGEKPGVGQLFHIGGEEEVTINELARRVARVVGGRLSITFEDPTDRWGQAFAHIGRRWPDTSLARSVLGWRATTSLDEGLRRTVAWAATSDEWSR